MLNKNELLFIVGGASLNGTIVNAFVRLFGIFYEVGQALGSSIRRIRTRNYCK